MKITIITFGYLHAPPPEATLTIDLRGRLFNPYKDRAMREMTGLEPEVYRRVLRTRGARRLIRGLVAAVRTLALADKDIVVAVGCSGGRHRSVAVGRRMARLLRRPVELVHRDVELPVYVHPAA